VHSYRQLQEILFFCIFAYLFSGSLGAAESLPERFLPLDGKIVEGEAQVEINWPKASGSNIGRVSIQRRILGQTNKESWQSIASIRSFARVYLDKGIQSGVAYEYRISRSSKEMIETGYWATGLNLPAEENRGVALVVVDETLAGDLASHLDRFMLDLTGDGWTVVRHDMPRGDDKDLAANLQAARKLRAWIQGRYTPGNRSILRRHGRGLA